MLLLAAVLRDLDKAFQKLQTIQIILRVFKQYIMYILMDNSLY